jgi:hypothetical protein
MTDYLFLIAKAFSVFLGLFLIVSRVFLFEETQGKIQSRIEDLWIRVDDYQKTAYSKNLALVKVIAGLITSGLDRNFGPGLVSLQSLTVSICYAVVTCLIAVSLLLRYGQGRGETDLLSALALYFTVAFVPFVVSYAGRAKRKKYLLIWLTASITSAYLMIVLPAFNFWKKIHDSDIRWTESLILGAYICVLVSLLLYSGFLVLMRLSLRLIRNSNSVIKTATISLLNLLPILGIYALGKLLLFKLEHSNIDPALDYKNEAVLRSVFSNWQTRIDVFLVLLLFSLFLFDLIFIVTAVVFGLVSALMYIHRAFWPVLSRIVYASQRFQIISNGNVLIYLGVFFILIGFGRLSWLTSIGKLF